MTRSFRWPLLAAALVGGVVAGRYVGLPTAHGDAVAAHTAIPAELTSYRDVVKQVLPAVVSIEAKEKPAKTQETNSRRGRTQQMPPGVPEEFRKYFQAPEGEAAPHQGHSFGSGFIVDPSGIIMTNNHVVDGAGEVEVTLTDGRKFTSSDIKTDPELDLAIVRVKASAPLPFLKYGDSNQMEIGDRVLAVGAPFGLQGSVTNGIISAKGRDLHMGRFDDYIQTDAAINPGNSGGPLVNLAGEVVGVNSAIKSRSGGFEGVGMAVTSNNARNVMQQLSTNGSVKRPYLGVGLAPKISPEVAARLGMKDAQGAVVTDVYPKTPAAKAGVKADDVITAIDGHPVTDNRSLVQSIVRLPVGKATTIEIIRDGQSQTLSLTLEEQPKDYGVRTLPTRGNRSAEDTVRLDKYGLELADLPQGRSDMPDLKGGAMVMSVDPDGPAAEAGIAKGVVITKVDRKDVNSAEAAKKAIEKGDAAKGVLLHVRSATGGTAIVLLKADKK
jgi:serine protease Do